MLDFLRSLAPRQAHALRPASPLRVADPAIPAAAADGDPMPADALPLAAPRRSASTVSPSSPATERATAAGDASRPRPEAVRQEFARSAGPRVTTDAMDPQILDDALPASPVPPAEVRQASPIPASSRRGPVAALAETPQPAAIRDDGIDAEPEDAERGDAFAAAIAPLSAAALARAAPDPAPAAPPAIHISIDRIEVRAAAAPARSAPPRPRAAAAPESLHDYLCRKPSP